MTETKAIEHLILSLGLPREERDKTGITRTSPDKTEIREGDVLYVCCTEGHGGGYAGDFEHEDVAEYFGVVVHGGGKSWRVAGAPAYPLRSFWRRWDVWLLGDRITELNTTVEKLRRENAILRKAIQIVKEIEP